MKANTLTIGLPLGGLLLSTIVFMVLKFSAIYEFIINELNNFDVHAFYAVAGIMATSVIVYALGKLIITDQKTENNKRVDYLYPRHLNYRAVIKKTA